MHSAAAGIDESFSTIVSELISLVEQVRAGINLVEDAIAREVSLGDADAGNVIVLDDVTPQYLKAGHALRACSASLESALHSLFETSMSARRPLRLVACR